MLPHFPLDDGGYDRIMSGSPLWEASHRGDAAIVAALRQAGASVMKPPDEIEAAGGWADELWQSKYPSYDRASGEWRFAG